MEGFQAERTVCVKAQSLASLLWSLPLLLGWVVVQEGPKSEVLPIFPTSRIPMCSSQLRLAFFLICGRGEEAWEKEEGGEKDSKKER